MMTFTKMSLLCQRRKYAILINKFEKESIGYFFVTSPGALTWIFWLAIKYKFSYLEEGCT